MSATQRFVGALLTGASLNPNNLVAGSIFEFTGQRPRRTTIYAVQDGATDAAPLVTSVTSGSNVQVEANTPVPAFTAGQGPNRDQHMLVSFLSAPGDRLVITLRNTAAVTSNYRFLIEFTD